MVFVMEFVDLPDVDQVVRKPRAEEVSGRQHSSLRVTARDLPIDLRENSQPIHRSGSLACEAMERFPKVTRVELVFYHRGLRINRGPFLAGILQEKAEPWPKIVCFLFSHVVDHFKDRPSVRRRLPHRLRTPDESQLALKDSGVRFQAVYYPGGIHCHCSRLLSVRTLQRG
jgi:hypothetical protein